MTKYNIELGQQKWGFSYHSLKAELKRGIDRLKSHRRAKTSRREMIKLGEHMLRDLGFDAAGQLLPPLKSATQISKDVGDCEVLSCWPQAWCDCKAS